MGNSNSQQKSKPEKIDGAKLKKQLDENERETYKRLDLRLHPAKALKGITISSQQPQANQKQTSSGTDEQSRSTNSNQESTGTNQKLNIATGISQQGPQNNNGNQINSDINQQTAPEYQ
ncbi:MAG: hypothetical protein EZS28_000626 [Streblomastix strix]|uniref:Uncharacterized protein n=1 Tax=Streblomastix strix TaxID=222440 RepID=A0A5J4X9R3_9EUKA|nr:MAG: hypothetical protein EZS28_000626 [Streblomastix strix]